MTANGWPLVPLGELLSKNETTVTLAPTDEYREVTIRLWGKGVVQRRVATGAEIAAERRFQVSTDQFIMSRIDARNGAMGIVPPELHAAVVTNDFPSFEVNHGRLLPAFLGWLSKTHGFVDMCRSASEGTTNRVRLKEDRFLRIAIPLPSLEEQRRIVAKIDRLAAKIEDARRIQSQRIAECAMLVASFTHDLFARQFHGRVDTLALGEIAEIRSGVTLGRDISGPVVELPYLRVANVQDGFLDLGSIKRVTVRYDEADKWKLHFGDLLLTEGGDWDKLGRGTIWEDQIPNCIHQNHIFRVRLNSPDFDPWYLFTLTSSPYGKAYFQGMSKQTTNLASINQAQLKAFPVYRVPRGEQHRIVSRTRSITANVDGLRRIQQQSDAELEAMLPSILDRAFKGAL